MSKHTPGQWEVLDGRRVSVAMPSKTEGCGWDSHCIALTYSHDPRINAEANARLIAAAPDLLAALEGLAKSSSVRHQHPEGHAKALAAIAKATGA